VTSTLLSKRVLVLLAGGALMLAGCGGGGGTVETSQSAAPTTPSTVNPRDMTDQQAPPDRLDINVTIQGGQVEPTNLQLETKVKDPIVVRVKSDAADELHVHSTPDHTFKIEPDKLQQFQFTVDVPGKVDIELHQLKKIIATVQVQP